MSKPQLFCFTHAGGTAAFFDPIERDLSGFAPVKLEYPGHGARHKEPCCRSFGELAEDAYCHLKDLYSGGDYALFGYSMGAITLVEVLQRILDDSGMRAPFHVFLAAHEPHAKAELSGFAAGESDEWVKERTVRFGAVPEKLQSNKSFWRMYLPLYRADYSLIGAYRFENLTLRADVPATVFYSEEDTPRSEMERWRDYFTGACTYHEFPGGHFFMQEHHRAMARIMDLEARRGGDGHGV